MLSNSKCFIALAFIPKQTCSFNNLVSKSSFIQNNSFWSRNLFSFRFLVKHLHKSIQGLLTNEWNASAGCLVLSVLLILYHIVFSITLLHYEPWCVLTALNYCLDFHAFDDMLSKTIHFDMLFAMMLLYCWCNY